MNTRIIGKSVLTVLSAFIVSFFLVASAAADGGHGGGNHEISGNVSFQGSGDPIGGVTMTAGGGVEARSTDSNGDYVLEDVPDGDYDVAGYRLGYDIVPSNFSNPVMVDGADVPDRNFEATCRSGFHLNDGVCVPNAGCQDIDFEGVAPGTNVFDEFSALGFTVTAINNNGPNSAVIFDTSNPTGGDFDLETPGSGPGNDTALDNVIVIAETVTDSNGDGLIDDPNDEADGGTLFFDFDEPRNVDNIVILDVDDNEPGGEVVGLNGGTEEFVVPIPTAGENSAQTINLPSVPGGITQLQVRFAASSAVGAFESCPVDFSIAGRALLIGSNTPVPGVSITGIGLGTTTTNASGEYLFLNVPNGFYLLSASKTGFIVVEDPDPNPVQVDNAPLVEQNFILACAEGFQEVDGDCVPLFSISGKVTLLETGDPIENVTIGGVNGSTTLTNAGGMYTFTNVSNGSYLLTATRTGYIVVTDPDPNPVVVNNASLTDQDFVMTCAPGFKLQNGICVPEDDPIIIEASDGTSTEFVEVVWTTDTCAATYQLFRSIVQSMVFQPGTELDLAGIIPAEATPTQTFFDTSAVPGVTYFYGTIAFDSNGVECNRSNRDPGFRLGQFDDCDGDGVSDQDEIAQGTDPCDPGSFLPRLASPTFAKWNTFLSQFNFLELISTGTKPVQATVTVLDISGNELSSVNLSIDPGQQFDVDINTMAGLIDTYGITVIDWNDEDPDVNLAGRMSVLRLDPNGQTFSFAFARELLNPTFGRTYATSNSFDPQGSGFLVPNWSEIINLEATTQTFTYRLFNQAGQVVFQRDIEMPGFSERDLTAGHEFGEGVYLAEVTPHDGASKYIFTVARYSSNTPLSSEAETYNFAMARRGQVGTADMQFAPISNESGGCFSQLNWVELTNVREMSSTATIEFRDENGNSVGTDTITLARQEQFHFNASALLPKGARGVVEVTSNVPGSVIMQSVVYYLDCNSNLTQTAYLSPGRLAGGSVLQGSYNRFLGNDNILTVVNTTAAAVDYTLEVRQNGELVSVFEQSVGGIAGTSQNISEGIFATATDTVGTVTVRADEARTLIGDVIRRRPDPLKAGAIDFAFQTPLN